MSRMPQCYPSAPTSCDNSPHPGWFHLTDWSQLPDALKTRVRVIDADGDEVLDFKDEVDQNYPSRRYVIEADGAKYSYEVWHILVNQEPNPYSEADEAEALRSIGQAYSNIRLTPPNN